MSHLDPIIRTLSSLTPEQKRELVARLSADNLAEISAAAAETAKRARIAKIATMRAERDPQLRLVEGVFARAGIKIEEAVTVADLDRLFAKEALRPVSAEDRLMCKAAMNRMGILSA
jgi:hypothetical protein